MENQNKTPWYRDSEGTKTTGGGQLMAVLHLLVVSALAYLLLFITLAVATSYISFLDDAFDTIMLVLPLLSFYFGYRSYRKTLNRYSKK